MKLGSSAVEKIGEYKMEILDRLMSSDKISKLLRHDSADALFKPSLEDSSELLYDRIYPFRFVPSPVENQGTWITLGLSGFRPHQEGYKIFDDYITGEFHFYVFTSVDLMKTDSGIRQDLIIAEIDRLFNGVKGLGMGEMKLSYVNELWLHNNKFGGYTVSYRVTDLK